MTRSRSVLALFAFLLLPGVAAAQISTYENPVDGKSYSGDWHTYEPQTPRLETGARVSAESVILLTSQRDLEERVTIGTLANYVRRLEAGLRSLAPDYRDHGRILLQIEMAQEESPVYKLGYEGAITNDLLRAYYEVLTGKTDAPEVSGSVSFQLVLMVREQPGPTTETPPE